MQSTGKYRAEFQEPALRECRLASADQVGVVDEDQRLRGKQG